MADKEVSALTASGDITDSDIAHIVQGGNSRKVVLANRFLTGDVAPAVAWSAAKKARARKTIAQAKVPFASSDTLVEAHRGAFVSLGGSTGTLSITDVATLTDGFECVLSNDASGDWVLDPNGAQLIDGAADATMKPGDRWKLFCDGSALRTVRSVPVAPQAARARIIAPSLQALRYNGLVANGRLAVNQEFVTGTKSGISAGTTYISDGVALVIAGAAVMSARQLVSSRAGGSDTLPTGFDHGQRVWATTADSSVASTDVVRLRVPVTGYRAADLGFGAAGASDLATGIWVRSGVTGTYAIPVRNSAANRSYIRTFTINAADTWEFKTFQIPGDTSGTWNVTTGVGLEVSVTLMAGSNFQGTADTWTATDDLTTSAQANLVAGTNASVNYFDIAGVGAWPYEDLTSFDAASLQACWPKMMRMFLEARWECFLHFWKSFPYATAPAANAGIAGELPWPSTVGASATCRSQGFEFPRPMLSAPTITFFNPSAAGNQARDRSASADCSSTGVQNASERGFWVNVTTAAGTAVGNLLSVHATADARI